MDGARASDLVNGAQLPGRRPGRVVRRDRLRPAPAAGARVAQPPRAGLGHPCRATVPPGALVRGARWCASTARGAVSPTRTTALAPWPSSSRPSPRWSTALGLDQLRPPRHLSGRRRWPRSGPPTGRSASTGWCCTAAGRTAGPSATRTAGGTCSAWSARTGGWGRTCSPSSTHRTRTRAPAGPSRRTSARPRRAETAVALLRLALELDVRPALAQVRAPTLVLHRREDRAAPVAQGRALAAAIPGAELRGARGPLAPAGLR